jgi:hypothetical protein
MTENLNYAWVAVRPLYDAEWTELAETCGRFKWVFREVKESALQAFKQFRQFRGSFRIFRVMKWARRS